MVVPRDSICWCESFPGVLVDTSGYAAVQSVVFGQKRVRLQSLLRGRAKCMCLARRGSRL